MSARKIISTGYQPRALQEILHVSLKRFNVLVCHRRFGKTVFTLNEMIDKGLRNEKKNPQYVYLAPFYGQAKRVAWDYLKEYTKHIPGITVNEADLRVDIPRPERGDKIRYFLMGADNPGALRGIYLDGVILDEYAEMFPEVWTQVLRPALSDRMGWAIFIGTPKGRNHFYDTLKYASTQKEWFTSVYKASETGIIPQSELDSAKSLMSEEEYEQEFECSFSAALVGAYYGKLMEQAEKDKRICNVSYDPALPVDTYWDLGIGDTNVIWFAQDLRREVHLIDYLEMSGQGLDFYVKELVKKPYTYGRHGLPHDAEARELGSGRTRTETLKTLGLRNIHIVPRQSVDDGIHAVRMLLPKCYFDTVKCARGIEALKNYEKKWDSKNKIYTVKPLHNWASHGSDAFRTLAMGRESESFDRNDTKLRRTSIYEYDIFTGEEL